MVFSRTLGQFTDTHIQLQHNQGLAEAHLVDSQSARFALPRIILAPHGQKRLGMVCNANRLPVRVSWAGFLGRKSIVLGTRYPGGAGPQESAATGWARSTGPKVRFHV
jgi:hypothetical protein